MGFPGSARNLPTASFGKDGCSEWILTGGRRVFNLGSLLSSPLLGFVPLLLVAKVHCQSIHLYLQDMHTGVGRPPPGTPAPFGKGAGADGSNRFTSK